jgi:hypothetical protein
MEEESEVTKQAEDEATTYVHESSLIFSRLLH